MGCNNCVCMTCRPRVQQPQPQRATVDALVADTSLCFLICSGRVEWTQKWNPSHGHPFDNPNPVSEHWFVVAHFHDAWHWVDSIRRFRLIADPTSLLLQATRDGVLATLRRGPSPGPSSPTLSPSPSPAPGEHSGEDDDALYDPPPRAAGAGGGDGEDEELVSSQGHVFGVRRSCGEFVCFACSASFPSRHGLQTHAFRLRSNCRRTVRATRAERWSP